MKMIGISLMMIFTFPLWATVTTGSDSCPVQFEGRVKEIIEPLGSEDFFATNKVVFESQEVLKGVVKDQVFVDVLKNGPFQVEVDKDYRVQLRDGKVCWIEEI